MIDKDDELPRRGAPYPEGTDRPYEHEVVEGEERADDATFLRVLAEASDVAANSGYPYAFMGGIASTVLGRERWTHDIDLIIRPEDARGMLRRFAAAGFETEERDQSWLYKAYRDDIMIDFIFRTAAPLFSGAITLDDQMISRVRQGTFRGVRLAVLSPEDLLVVKALVHKEFRSRHWFDALGLVAAGGLDWGYVTRRAAERNPRRVLSLLLYAQSDGLHVPEQVIHDLLAKSEGAPAGAGQVAAGVVSGRAGAQPAGSEAEPETYLVGRLEDRFARDPRTAELEVDVDLEGDVLVLTGCVATAERREALTEVAASVVPGYRVRNAVTIAGPPAQPTVEHVEPAR
jgi:Uncharacterised nucleotidyltransferase